jgi:hypothetical protein
LHVLITTRRRADGEGNGAGEGCPFVFSFLFAREDTQQRNSLRDACAEDSSTRRLCIHPPLSSSSSPHPQLSCLSHNLLFCKSLEFTYINIASCSIACWLSNVFVLIILVEGEII